ncbi:acylphosphatase [Phoenix dactylifera]|uniref:Acylphosphatase n=1 Tax=Phoenix dactylifera TaxID=42345 RepID=A0A8B8J8V5_PHODC|nr:acylphosphatase [Phoenix dactylifera]
MPPSACIPRKTQGKGTVLMPISLSNGPFPRAASFFSRSLHPHITLGRNRASQNLAMNTFAAAATPPMPPSTKKTVKVVIKGRVQGVFFRDWTVQNARELGLNGWVRNRRDGSVEALFSGDPNAVNEMVEKRCRVGPPAAAVTALNAFPSNEDPGQGFERKPTM